MGLENTFGNAEKVEKEKVLEVVASEESIKDGLLANLIIFGKTFYDASLPVALRQALEYATPEGIVASMPELIAAKIKVDKSHDFWQNWYTTHTEENIGVDKKGLHGKKNNPVLVVVHGGGILTPNRIEKAYKEGLIAEGAKYTETEFGNLLKGKLPNGETIQLYTLNDLKKGTPKMRRFGVVMDYETAQSTKSGWHKKGEFVENPLVIARAGGLENLEEYFEKAKRFDGDLGNWHQFGDMDPNQGQGVLLFLGNDDLYGGLNGDNNLYCSGRFVGVAPEAHNTRK